jgi:hypothetical protein
MNQINKNEEQNLGKILYNGAKEFAVEEVKEWDNKTKFIATIIIIAICLLIAIGAFIYIDNFLSQSIKTSSLVIGDFKQIEDIRVLRVNKAEIYEDIDSNGRQNGIFIFRYSVDVYYNLKDCRFIPTSERTFILEVSPPEIKGVLDGGCKTTLEKAVDEYPGIEIFDWNVKKYETNELEKMAQRYIENDIKSNKGRYEELSLQNLKEQLNILFSGFDAFVSDIKFSSGGQKP